MSLNPTWKARFLSWLHFLKVALVWMRYLQVPLVAAVIGAGLAASVVMKAGPYSLTVGAYDGQPEQVVTVALVSILFSFALWDISKLIWQHGPDRFNLRDAEGSVDSVRFTPGLQHESAKAVLWMLFASVPILTYKACAVASELPRWGWLVWAAVYAVMWWGHCKGMPLIERKLGRLVRLPAGLAARLSKVPGYSDPERGGVAAGHLKQIVMLVLCAVVSLAIWKLPDSEAAPAAVYVLLIVLGMAWVCSGLGFYFWRYHVPLFLVIGLWVGVGGWWHPDYEYRVLEMREKQELPSAEEILRNSSERRIAVAAVGGGIHSGAWATEVLTRLQEISGEEKLPDRICALSGTSGGAYGLMHYAHAVYHGSREMKDMPKLREAAQAPSLGAVVSAMAYHDLPSYFAPLWSTGKDRGTAMEQRWAANAAREGMGPKENLSRVTLAEWGQQARDGRMPAVLFTAGTEESGRPTIYGSSRVWDWNWNADQVGAPYQGCPHELKDYTVPVVTGARLSSTFPFVSPVARPAADGKSLRRVQHQMDGGYYDNYGLVALNRWMEEGLRAVDPDNAKSEHDKGKMTNPDYRHFLVIQIRYKESSDSSQTPKKGGFFYQSTAPMTGLYNARVAGQRLRADEQFDVFCRYWEQRGVIIDNVAFEFDASDGAALSWHLTAADKKRLTEQGEKLVNDCQIYSDSVKRWEELHARGQITDEELHKHKSDLHLEYPNGESAYRVIEFLRTK